MKTSSRTRRVCYFAFAYLFTFGFGALLASAEEVLRDDSASVLARRINSFRVQNAPIAQIGSALNELGIRVCVESIAKRAGVKYVDADGNLVFDTEVYSITAEDVVLSDLLDRLVCAAPDYKWEIVRGTNVINIVPKRGSRLLFDVAPFGASARMDQILGKTTAAQRFPALSLHGPLLPMVEIAFAGGTGRGLLNDIVVQDPTIIWRVDRFLIFSSTISAPPRTSVEIVYDIRRGEPIVDFPDYRLISYQQKTVRFGDGHRVIVERVTIDLVIRETESLPEPKRTVVRQYVAVVRAMLREDVAALTGAMHPDGVRDGKRRLSRDQLQAGFKAAFEKKDYTQFHLRDVLDLDKIEVKAKGDGRFRVSTKPKIKYLDKQLYFDDELWFTFEKSEDGKWYIVELD